MQSEEETRPGTNRAMVAEAIVVVLAIVLGLISTREFHRSPPPRATHVSAVSTPPPSPTETASPGGSPPDAPSPSITDTSTPAAVGGGGGGPVGPGAPPSPLGPPPAGPPVAAVSTIVYTNGPPNIQIYGAADAGKPLMKLPGHNIIDQPTAFLVINESPGWFQVLLPVKPNGTSGWVKAGDVQMTTTNRYLRVTVSQFRLDQYVDGHWQNGVRVALGKPSTPTPTGLFYIWASEAVDSAPYTPGIFALSGFAPQPIPGFLGATLGLHGWTDASVIGTRASNGCVRVASRDMDPLLHSLILGTPVDIEA